VAADLTRSENIGLLAGKFPDIDILVNNAGAIPGGNLQDVDEATWRAAWDLKVFGYINMCRAFYPLLKRHGGGVIVNVVGTAAQSRDPGYICGVAGNAALSAFSQSLGSESHKDGIRVVAIAPGPISTDRLVTLLKKRAADKLGDAGKWQEFFAGFPFGRAGEPNEVAAAIVFNASRYSAYTSGSIVTVDGGRSARSN
jgi:NAD(P)-dependent dehydrogenase (short-subunit alcohol dehydrogenase family)